MKDFIPNINKQKKLIENVLGVSAKAREEKAKNPDIINATVGSYYDEDGKIKVFDCVKDAFTHPDYDNYLSYSSVKGSNAYIEAVQTWVLGENYKKIYDTYLFNTIATCGGTGAIALAFATYLEKGEGLLLPHILWPSYIQIANNLGIQADFYQLYDEKGNLDLRSIEQNAILMQEKYDKVFLVINDPCHNPTGLVMSDKDYKGLVQVLNRLAKKTKVVLLLDIAYLDYGSDNGKKTRENFTLLKELSTNVMVLFSFSASKTFGIYGLRLGALIQMTKLVAEAKLFSDATSYFARSTWSNTTHLGIEIVSNTLNNPDKKEAFIQEINATSDNLAKRSQKFIQELKQYEVPFAPYQNGFFVLILVDNKNFEQEIEAQGAYGCHFGKGYRIALSSVNLEEASKLGCIIGKAYQNIVNK